MTSRSSLSRWITVTPSSQPLDTDSNTSRGRLLHRHESAIEVGAAGAPNESEEPGHADDDDWSRYREVGFSGSRHRWGWQRGCSPSSQAALCSDVLSEAAAVPCRHRGMCIVALLVARARWQS